MRTVEKFIDLFSTFTFAEVIAVIVLTILGLKGAVELFKTIKKDLETWYQKKRGIEKKDETIEQRVQRLEENDEKQIKCLDEISDNIDKIIERIDQISSDARIKLDKINEDYRNTTVAESRATLYQLAKELENREYISMAEYETFVDLSQIYLNNGGNSVFKNKIIPTIESLPIKD